MGYAENAIGLKIHRASSQRGLRSQRKVERQVKVLIKNLAIFFLFPSKEFLPISFKQFVCLLCHQSPPHTHGVYSTHRTHSAEIETGMAEQSRRDKANRQQKLGLVWKNRKKISQIIKVYCYLPFFLLIILWGYLRMCVQGGMIISIPTSMYGKIQSMW